MNPSQEAIIRAARVVNFLQRRSFFDKTFDTSMQDAIIITDPNKALEYANKLDYDDESYEDLTDLLATEKVKLKKSLPSVFGLLDSRISKLVSEMTQVNALEAFLTESERKVLEANFDYQMVGCVENLNASKPSELYDQILLGYEAGGIPCGWMGKYPKGKLIVLLPSRTVLPG
jgi:hypothetical protein